MAEWVRPSTGDRTVDGPSPTSVETFLFGTLAIPFTPLCQCLSDETVNAVGPFYLVSMPGEVKVPPVRTGICNCRGLSSHSKPPRSASMAFFSHIDYAAEKDALH